MSMIPPTSVPTAFAPAGLSRTKLVMATTVAEACRHLAEARAGDAKAVVLAGGTDWLVDRQMLPSERAHDVDLVVDVTGIAELREVRLHTVKTLAEESTEEERRLTLGGGVTYWMLRNDARIRGVVPMLEAMARDVGAVQIQSRGTLAGNIATASPAADGVAALMALEGVVTLVRSAGSREVPLSAFFTGYRATAMEPGELIVKIDLRVPRPRARVGWRKVGTRLAQAISKVALASMIETDPDGIITRARFGMASVAAVTSSLPTVQSYVEGIARASLDRSRVEAALAADVSPKDDVRSTGAYRSHVAGAILWRALTD